MIQEEEYESEQEPSTDQDTSLSEVDELRELIEKLSIRQRRTERKLLKTSKELDRVSKELETVHNKQHTDPSKKILQKGDNLKKGDKVLVTTRTKNRCGDLAVVHRQPHPSATFVWVLPEGKSPGNEYKVTRKCLEPRV